MAALLYKALCSRCEAQMTYADSPVSLTAVCEACLPPKPTKPEPKRREVRLDKPPKAKASRKASQVHAKTDTERFCGAHAIYVIQMRPGVVKVGRTANWAQRKLAYTHGFDDVIKRSVIFWIIDDFEHLPEIETGILQSIHSPRAKGFEWIMANFDSIAMQADRFLRANGILFERE